MSAAPLSSTDDRAVASASPAFARPSPNANVLLIGAGGIGAPCALALGQAGVGSLTVVDADRVDLSNLHRQVLFSDRDIGRLKIAAFAEQVAALFPAMHVEIIRARFTAENARDLLGRASVVIDATDNFATRFLVADACHIAQIPVVHTAAIRFRATVIAAAPEGRPCYRCLFEDLPNEPAPDCGTAGVIGPVCGVAGSLAADRAVRLLAGDTSATGVITTYDGLRSTLRDVVIRPRADCPLCGAAPQISTVESFRYAAPACPATPV
ncbi:MAG: ThiF family adenylyltransferase [Polyangiaceae bacterium]|nr:ThiF family adenylyltransferase [Polyangiaceae bacterium]